MGTMDGSTITKYRTMWYNGPNMRINTGKDNKGWKNRVQRPEQREQKSHGWNNEKCLEPWNNAWNNGKQQLKHCTNGPSNKNKNRNNRKSRTMAGTMDGTIGTMPVAMGTIGTNGRNNKNKDQNKQNNRNKW